MFAGKPFSSPVRPPLLRRLDYLPGWLGMALGVGAGALLGVGLALTSPIVGGAGFLALLGLAIALAFSGEPITVLDRPVARKTGQRAEAAPAAAPGEHPLEPEAPLANVDDGVPMVSIAGGVFLMGSPGDEKGRSADEGPVHQVRVAAFECMAHPVTLRLYRELMRADHASAGRRRARRPAASVA